MTPRSPLRFGLAALFALVLLAPPVSGAAPSAPEPAPKIASRVLADTAAGASASFLVVLKEQADLSPAARLAGKPAKGRFVVNALRAVAARTQPAVRAQLDALGVDYQPYWIVNMIRVTGSRAVVDALAARPDVARIDADPWVTVPLPRGQAVPVGPDAVETVEPNLKQIRAHRVWQAGIYGQGIVIAGQDTGIDWDHPALVRQYRGTSGSTVDHNYNWWDAINHRREPYDDHAHGTHTIGTAVGWDGGANHIGVAFGARWIGCKNMNAAGTGSPSTYTECFQFMLAPTDLDGNNPDPDRAPHVTTNSWGCPPSEGCNQDTLRRIVETVRAAGIAVIVAAGNSGPSCSSIVDPPAHYDASYTVGSVNSSNNLSFFSSRGPVTVDGSNRVKPDLTAPGENIRSSVPGGGYEKFGWSGTSMATPHVAGTWALVWSAVPGLIGEIDATEARINAGATERSTAQCSSSGTPNNLYGYGVVNAARAVAGRSTLDAALPLLALGGR